MIPWMIGISGPSASGKSLLAEAVRAANPNTVVVQQDWYFRDSTEGPPDANFCELRWLHVDDLVRTVSALSSGQPTKVPVIDFATFRQTGTAQLAPAPVVIIEGMTILRIPEVDRHSNRVTMTCLMLSNQSTSCPALTSPGCGTHAPLPRPLQRCAPTCRLGPGVHGRRAVLESCLAFDEPAAHWGAAQLLPDDRDRRAGRRARLSFPHVDLGPELFGLRVPRLGAIRRPENRPGCSSSRPTIHLGADNLRRRRLPTL